MTNCAISVSDLEFAYEKTPILSQKSLKIERGSFLGIIGPNGGGKTTFLKLLMGFLKPAKGKIEILGISPEKARTQIGYVPQVHKCDREFPITVEELVLLGGISSNSRFGAYPKQIKEKAMVLMERLGLTDHAKKTFGSLSGGLAQRALLARALISDPKLLLLDEPTANVDPESTKTIIETLSCLKQTKTILLVTHDFKTIAEDVDQVLCIQGTIRCQDADQICNHFSVGVFHSPVREATSVSSLS